MGQTDEQIAVSLNVALRRGIINRWMLFFCFILEVYIEKRVYIGWLGSGVVSVLNSAAEGPGFKLQPRRCRVTVLGKLFN